MCYVRIYGDPYEETMCCSELPNACTMVMTATNESTMHHNRVYHNTVQYNKILVTSSGRKFRCILYSIELVHNA